MVKTVGVMGVGPAGLCATKRMHEAGFNVISWERWPDIGGSWHHCYENLHLQSQKTAFAFTDYQMPDDYPAYPSNTQMMEYFHSYVKHFGIEDCIRTNSNVAAARLRDGGGWIVTVEKKDPQSGDVLSTEDHEVDFLINSAGICCYERIPDLPGMDEFEAAGGSAIHTYHVNKAVLSDVVEKTSQRRQNDDDQRVRMVVLGFGKSGLDVGTNVADDPRFHSVHYTYRNPRWFSPKYIYGLVNHKHFLYSPFLQAMPPWFSCSLWEKLIYVLTRPLTIIFVLFFQSWLRGIYKELGSGVPDESLLTRFPTCSFFLQPPDLPRQIKEKKVVLHPRTTIERFTSKGVVLTDGTELEADFVLLATGYTANWSWLPSDLREKATCKEDGLLWLYKHVMHPDLPDMAFIGYQSALNSLACFDSAASWLADYLKGKVPSQPRDVMFKDIADRKKWYKSWKGPRYMAPCVAGHEYYFQRALRTEQGMPYKPLLHSWFLDYITPKWSDWWSR